ncbi:hypothetical protein [Runella salmonicolor]|uniref:Lipoprotein n=1 Tax=Runella salmonicolor TaxID=2950278 RepID=A0ABT1FV25_9BACT|nr:hypothetical protein [Runella salmonicolor]MCP1385609.1 hypothetical protein [Runella salmonicolor]
MKSMQVKGLAIGMWQQVVNHSKSTGRKAIWGIGAVLTLGMASCDTTDDNVGPNFIHTSDFNKGNENWEAGLTDFSTQQDSIMEFSSKITALPTDSLKKGFMLTSHNRSDDAFMYLKRKLTGLAPNQTYDITFEVELASKYPENGVGVGGSPGGAVYLKAGASGIEPQKVKDSTNAQHWTLNWDKGNQSSGGKNAIVLGTVGIEGETYKYQIIKRTNQSKAFSAKTNDKGELWLLVGTDSGFEGITTLYYTKVKAVLLKATL